MIYIKSTKMDQSVILCCQVHVLLKSFCADFVRTSPHPNLGLSTVEYRCNIGISVFVFVYLIGYHDRPRNYIYGR